MRRYKRGISYFIIMTLVAASLISFASAVEPGEAGIILDTKEQVYQEIARNIALHNTEFELSVSYDLTDIIQCNSSYELFQKFAREYDNGSIRWTVYNLAYGYAIQKNDAKTYYFERFSYRSTVEQEDFAKAKAAEIMRSLRKGTDNQFDIMDKVRDYWTQNWSYDYTHQNESAYSVFTTTKGTCLGLTMATQMLLDAAGINTRTIDGDMKSRNGYHIWMLVELNGYWYSFDPTAFGQEEYYLNNNNDLYNPRSAFLAPEFIAAHPMSPISYRECEPYSDEIVYYFRAGVILPEFFKGMKQAASRQEAAALLVNAVEFKTKQTLEQGSTSFVDINTSPYKAQIEKAASSGYIYGMTMHVFNPYGTITKEQLSVMIGNVWSKYTGQKVTGQTSYKDVSPWASSAVKTITSLGVLSGKGGTFSAKSDMSREALCTAVIAFIKAV